MVRLSIHLHRKEFMIQLAEPAADFPAHVHLDQGELFKIVLV